MSDYYGPDCWLCVCGNYIEEALGGDAAGDGIEAGTRVHPASERGHRLPRGLPPPDPRKAERSREELPKASQLLSHTATLVVASPVVKGVLMATATAPGVGR